MKKGLYKFYWDCGRQGDLDGLFVATQEEVDNIIGKEVNFGEALGKHSEVYGTVDKDDITLITNSEEVIKIFEEHNISCGYNPLEYYDADLEEEE